MPAAAREQRYLIPGPVGRLEVVVAHPSGSGPLSSLGCCALVCHPHPLYGGAMDNKVVTTLARTYLELGVAVARFNFRGVGDSEGVYDQGVGEVKDLHAVAHWWRGQCAAQKLLLAGFSFGGGVVARGSHDLGSVSHLVLVAPALGEEPPSIDQLPECPLCVVVAEDDELVDPAALYRWADSLGTKADLIVMPGASHFFHGQLMGLRQRVGEVLVSRLGSP